MELAYTLVAPIASRINQGKSFLVVSNENTFPSYMRKRKQCQVCCYKKQSNTKRKNTDTKTFKIM